MTRDDIIRLAREIATQCCNRSTSWQHDYAMTRIMELIDASIAAEREACAKVCDNAEERAQAEYGGYPEKQAYLDGREFAARECAAAIRARGEP